MSRPVALITGAGRYRIGAVTARRLWLRGYDVVIHYHRTPEAVLQETVRRIASGSGPGKVEVYSCDVTDESAVRTMVDAVMGQFGRIDVVVNAASIWKPRPLEETTAADLMEHFQVNALGTFLVSKEAGLRMVSQPQGGCIVMIGDWAEARPYRHYSAYFPSKGAVSVMIRSLAVELAERNPRIRVNGVLPGPVMLPADLSADERGEAIAGTLVKREGSPENVASAVLALIDNDFVTGVCLPVDGGRTIRP